MYRYPDITESIKLICISAQKNGRSAFLAPFCHALLPSFDLSLETSKLCFMKAFSWSNLSYFCPSPGASLCLFCLLFKSRQSQHWFGAVLCMVLRYVWAPSPTFLFARSSAELHLEEGSGRRRKENHRRGSSLAWGARTGSSVGVVQHSVDVWFFMDRFNLMWFWAKWGQSLG